MVMWCVRASEIVRSNLQSAISKVHQPITVIIAIMIIAHAGTYMPQFFLLFRVCSACSVMSSSDNGPNYYNFDYCTSSNQWIRIDHFIG